VVDTPSPLMRRSAALDGSAAAENETKEWPQRSGQLRLRDKTGLGSRASLDHRALTILENWVFERPSAI
jgi:hypothetical protein